MVVVASKEELVRTDPTCSTESSGFWGIREVLMEWKSVEATAEMGEKDKEEKPIPAVLYTIWCGKILPKKEMSWNRRDDMIMRMLSNKEI